MDFIAAVILGIAMGITEFLPVSSLGHSLVLESAFNFPQTITVGSIQNARNAIGFFIEGGAVLAVLSRSKISEIGSKGGTRVKVEVLTATDPW